LRHWLALTVVSSLFVAPSTTCIQSSLIYCGDDLVCPHGTSCDLTNHTCISCGNGVVDPDFLETCEDTDSTTKYLNHDGCSQTCAKEVPTWKPLQMHGRLRLSAMAYDPAHRRVVLFGGIKDETFHLSNETWFLEDDSWTRGPLAPAALTSRLGHAMVYDHAHKRFVLVGGSVGLETIGDTWFLEDNSWVKGPPAPEGFLPRELHAMVYDPTKNRVVLFGGRRGGTAYLNDTWFLEGDTWRRGPEAPPQLTPRHSHALAYDVTSRRVILFGGFDGARKRDTWMLEGETWIQKPLVPNDPPERAYHTMTYDPVSGHVVLFGGSQIVPLGDTWVFDGDAWVETPAPEGPLPRDQHVMTYDAAHSRIVVFGGRGSEPSPGITNETWFLKDDTWSKLPTNEIPSRQFHAMVFDQRMGHIVIFGGKDGAVDTNSTFFLKGSSLLSGPATPDELTPRSHHAMAYDSKKERVVLFGGLDSDNQFRNDTWFLQGGEWIKGPPAPSGLEPRGSHAMTYDFAGERVVLFGGIDDDNYRNDTWFLEGDSWVPAPSSPALPAGRKWAAMSYDHRAKRVILFGGFDGEEKNDTWLLDAQGRWTQIQPQSAPSPRSGHTLTYEPALGRTVLFGGGFSNETWTLHIDLQDPITQSTWEYSPDPLANEPVPRFFPAMDYNAVERRMVLFGGATVSGEANDIWTFRFERAGAPEEDCRLDLDSDNDGLSGCADPDCRGTCRPRCPLHVCDDDGTPPGCGDGIWNSALENCRNCPADVGACVDCGDFICTTPGETAATCPGDCG
jgi:hypothetical protein